MKAEINEQKTVDLNQILLSKKKKTQQNKH